MSWEKSSLIFNKLFSIYKKLFASTNFFSEVIRNEVEELGFFNGYISVSNNGKLWFCDYGKRYDTEGTHIGYDLVINKTADSATEYMKHFYANKINNKKRFFFVNIMLATI